MNIMKRGTSAFIYDQSLQVLGRLPSASCWKVEYDDRQGAFLMETDAPSKPEMKVYGDHGARAEHILRAYQSRQGAHTGVILSGAKGIGKTLFARILALKAMDAGYPVIRVDRFVPGLAEFLASIKQDACILTCFSCFFVNSCNSHIACFYKAAFKCTCVYIEAFACSTSSTRRSRTPAATPSIRPICSISFSGSSTESRRVTCSASSHATISAR